MANTNFSFVSVGRNTKKYSHPKPFHVDSSGDFGSFQPFLCELLMGGDSLNISNFTQLVRNNTMPSPTFGRINCKNDFYFVPMCDLYPAFDSLRDHSSVNGVNGLYIPTSVPLISSYHLLFFMFTNKLFSTYEIYKVYTVSGVHQGSGYKMIPFDDNDYEDYPLVNALFDYFSIKLSRENPINKDWFLDDSLWYDPLRYGNPSEYKSLSRKNSDYILTWETPYNGEADDRYGLEFRFKFTATGRRLFKVLKGLGYSMEFTNDNMISMLPLFAFYKAWFDHYYIQRVANWHATSCYGLINCIYSFGDNDFTSSNLWPKFRAFLMYELCQCWYTYPADFVSANVSNVNEGAGDVNLVGTGLVNAPSASGASLDNSLNSQRYPNVGLYGSTVSAITLVKLQTINRVQRIFNKRGKYGSRVYEYIKKNFGEEVAEDMFKPSYDIANLITPVVIDDTYSTADTANLSVSDTGQHLGYRGGIGDGLSANKSVERYTAPTAGYYIAMMAIYPDSNWCQGDDGHLYSVGRTSFPTDEFDALGYEYTPTGMIYDNRGEVSELSPVIGNTSFGLMPRHSKFKTKRNLVNGCMEYHSTRDSFESFYLDRVVTPPHLYYAYTDEDDHEVYVRGGSPIPNASPIWFSSLRYPQLGWFNRIFFNSGYPANLNSYFYDDVEINPIEDNFVIQMNVEYELINSLKPMSQSYDTFDETKDNTSSDVTTV